MQLVDATCCLCLPGPVPAISVDGARPKRSEIWPGGQWVPAEQLG